MRRQPIRISIVLCALCAACGQKGPLVLPDRGAHPSPSGARAAATQTGSVPANPAGAAAPAVAAPASHSP